MPHYFARRRIFGLTIGSLWLVVASMAFATWTLIAIGTTAATAALIVLLAGALAVVTWDLGAMRAVWRLPGGFGPTTPEGKKIGKQFGIVVAAEAVVIGVVTGLCLWQKKFALIVPLDLIVVGLHFIPLAGIFRVPRYHVLGILFSVIPAVTLWAMPANVHVGHAVGQFVVPGLACGVVALVIAALGVREARKFVADENGWPKKIS